MSRRRGRPPKSADRATRDRLLDAAAAACVADGFESVTLAGIADRAGVTAAAIYNHFASKEELLYAAGRRALNGLTATLSPGHTGGGAVHDVAAAYLRPDMASTRRLFLELHLAGARHPVLAAHLREWHSEFAKVIEGLTPADDAAPTATVKAVFLLLLGLCHLEDLDAVTGDPGAVAERVDRLVDALYPRATDPVTSFPDDLRKWVEEALDGELAEAEPIGSGASRAIWRVVVARDGEHWPFVVRADTGTGPVAGTRLDLAREAAVYAALNGIGLPVPTLHAIAPGGQALLMEHVHGVDALTLAEPDERRAVGDDYLRWLARLHLLDVSSLPLPGFTIPTDGPGHALADLALWSSILAQRAAAYAAPSTLFALAWLRAHPPAVAPRTSLCHGDAGPGNFLYAGGKVTALLDWEFAHVGDPQDDLAWVTVRNHLLGQPMEVDAAFAAWSETTGLAIDGGALEYYRVLVLARMAISCDATVAWKGGGVEDDESIRTQVLLRPWLGRAIATCLPFAGCTEPDLAAVTRAADERFTASPHAEILGLIPPLEPLAEP